MGEKGVGGGQGAGGRGQFFYCFNKFKMETIAKRQKKMTVAKFYDGGGHF